MVRGKKILPPAPEGHIYFRDAVDSLGYKTDYGLQYKLNNMGAEIKGERGERYISLDVYHAIMKERKEKGAIESGHSLSSTKEELHQQRTPPRKGRRSYHRHHKLEKKKQEPTMFEIHETVTGILRYLIKDGEIYPNYDDLVNLYKIQGYEELPLFRMKKPEEDVKKNL